MSSRPIALYTAWSSLTTLSSYQERPWKALVGKEKKAFHVHPFVLCKASSVFEARVKGSWKKTTDCALDWTRFTEETVDCVLQFLYTGKYTPWERSQGPLHGPEASATMTGMLALSFLERLLTFHLNYQVPPSSNNTPPEGDAAGATSTLGQRILLHAQVHAFATEYLVRDLEEYAFVCMESCFAEDETVSPQILPDLLMTIDHVYENTSSSGTNRLREAICGFVAENYFVLIPDGAANLLAEAHGSFMADLSYRLAHMAFQNMSTTGKFSEDPEEEEHEIVALENAVGGMKEEIAILEADLAVTFQELRNLQKRKRFRESRV